MYSPQQLALELTPVENKTIGNVSIKISSESLNNPNCDMLSLKNWKLQSL